MKNTAQECTITAAQISDTISDTSETIGDSPAGKPDARRGSARRWLFRLGWVFLTMFWLAMMAAAWTEDASAATGDDADGYSFNWLDPEKKIYVLQNRKYEKAKRALISGMVGMGLSNPYRSTVNFDGRVAFYFTEAYGLEAFFTGTKNTSNNTYDALVGTHSSVFPRIREIQSMYGAMGHWVPWYAKINVFNQILYFDWYFGAGAGTLHTQYSSDPSANPVFTPEDLFSLFAATGHQYHLSHDLTFRLDLTAAYYRAGYDNTGDKAWFSNYNFGFGVGIRL